MLISIIWELQSYTQDQMNTFQYTKYFWKKLTDFQNKYSQFNLWGLTHHFCPWLSFINNFSIFEMIITSARDANALCQIVNIWILCSFIDLKVSIIKSTIKPTSLLSKIMDSIQISTESVLCKNLLFIIIWRTWFILMYFTWL